MREKKIDLLFLKWSNSQIKKKHTHIQSNIEEILRMDNSF